MKAIGIDPGLAATGIGIVAGAGRKIDGFSYGTIRTPSGLPLPDRLHSIHSRLFSVFDAEKPDLIVVEDVFSLRVYPKSGITLGKVCGVVLLAASQTGASVCEVAVREAKQVLTGNGSASKSQLEKAVRHLLRSDCPIRPDHASDAVALALIGIYRYTGRILG